jgi:hypothetical protein
LADFIVEYSDPPDK